MSRPDPTGRSLDYATLDNLRENHPAWRMLASTHAPLVASFLHRAFVQPNVRVMDEADLVEALENDLFNLRERNGNENFPKKAFEYLNDWAAPEKGWLRKFYKPGTDEAQFDITPATEKVIAWLLSLSERPFVGTESRLLTLFVLLEQISTGTEADPIKRVEELRKKRAEIDDEIARVQAGEVSLLGETAIKDRFQQFQQLARDLLSDFREVEHNFRQLDRKVRAKIALWDGGKGALLDEIMGERDAISDSDQGRSFRAFWEFLMSSSRQQKLSELLKKALALPAVAALKPESRTSKVHWDWLEAGEHTQRTVAQLSQQLRRFLDDRAFQENRRILELLRGIESKALNIREESPSGIMMHIDAMGADTELPLERPLFNPKTTHRLTKLALKLGDDDIDTSRLYEQIFVDNERIRLGVQQALRHKKQVTLCELLETEPLRHGLAELVAYLELANAGGQFGGLDGLKVHIDEAVEEPIRWQVRNAKDESLTREARLPRVIFTF